MPSASHFAAPGLHPLFMVTGWHRLLDTCAHAHPAHSFASRWEVAPPCHRRAVTYAALPVPHATHRWRKPRPL